MELYGYRRPDGSVGVRNHVIILPVDDISNAACEAVAAKITGTLALPHAYGRLQYGDDLELHFRTMIGTGANPNVAAAIVIGIEPTWTERIVEGIAATGKPVAGFSIEGQGDSRSSGRRAGPRSSFVQQRERAAARAHRALGAHRQHQVRRVGHDHRPWLLPDGRRGGRPAGRRGRDRLLRRDLRAHRRRAPRRCADGHRRGPGGVPRSLRRLRRGDRGGRGRPARLAADPGEHRRRALDDRGESARQHPEDGQPPGRRCARARGAPGRRAQACTSWTPPRPRRNASR